MILKVNVHHLIHLVFKSTSSRIFICYEIFTTRKRSCGKVMFLHLSVILFTGGCLPLGPWGCLPLGPGDVCLWVPGVCTPWTHMPGQTPPGHTPHRQTLPWADTTPIKVTIEAGGTHPTGMHSCVFFI